MTGFSEDCGCWKIIGDAVAADARAARSGDSVSRSRPSKMTSPASIRPGVPMSRRIESDVTDLPQPDSPTSPTTSSRATVKSTPVTARTTPARV